MMKSVIQPKTLDNRASKNCSRSFRDYWSGLAYHARLQALTFKRCSISYSHIPVSVMQQLSTAKQLKPVNTIG